MVGAALQELVNTRLLQEVPTETHILLCDNAARDGITAFLGDLDIDGPIFAVHAARVECRFAANLSREEGASQSRDCEGELHGPERERESLCIRIKEVCQR